MSKQSEAYCNQRAKTMFEELRINAAKRQKERAKHPAIQALQGDDDFNKLAAERQAICDKYAALIEQATTEMERNRLSIQREQELSENARKVLPLYDDYGVPTEPDSPSELRTFVHMGLVQKDIEGPCDIEVEKKNGIHGANWLEEWEVTARRRAIAIRAASADLPPLPAARTPTDPRASLIDLEDWCITVETQQAGDMGNRPIHLHTERVEIVNNQNITIGGNAQGNAFGHGSRVTNVDSFNHCADPAAAERELAAIKAQIVELQATLPADMKKKVGLLAEKLEEAVKSNDPKSRGWYSISAKGLLEASAWVKDFTGNIAGTIGNLGKAIWSDYTLPD